MCVIGVMQPIMTGHDPWLAVLHYQKPIGVYDKAKFDTVNNEK